MKDFPKKYIPVRRNTDDLISANKFVCTQKMKSYHRACHNVLRDYKNL